MLLHKIIARLMKLLTGRSVLVEEEGRIDLADGGADSYGTSPPTAPSPHPVFHAWVSSQACAARIETPGTRPLRWTTSRIDPCAARSVRARSWALSSTLSMRTSPPCCVRASSSPGPTCASSGSQWSPRVPRPLHGHGPMVHPTHPERPNGNARQIAACPNGTRASAHARPSLLTPKSRGPLQRTISAPAASRAERRPTASPHSTRTIGSSASPCGRMRPMTAVRA